MKSKKQYQQYVRFLKSVLICGFVLALCVPVFAQDTVLDFEDVAVGAIPEGWKVESSNAGAPVATWAVVQDAKAFSKAQVLTVTPAAPAAPAEGAAAPAAPEAPAAPAENFNLFWNDQVTAKNGQVCAMVKPIGGEKAQVAGLMWRIQDSKNYYLICIDYMANKVTLYCVQNGVATELKSGGAGVSKSAWVKLELEFDGTGIECQLNDEVKLSASDSTIPGSGGVGLWTKEDAATSFDLYEIEPSS